MRFVRVLRMKLFYYGISSFLCFTFLFLGCDGEVDYQYYPVVDSYYANFYGYYYCNGTYEDEFSGKADYTNEYGYTHYYYEKGLDVEGDAIQSVKIYAYKEDPIASVTISIFKDNVEIESVSTGSYEGYDEDTEKYTLTVGPLYYEFSDESDDSDDSE